MTLCKSSTCICLCAFSPVVLTVIGLVGQLDTISTWALGQGTQADICEAAVSEGSGICNTWDLSSGVRCCGVPSSPSVCLWIRQDLWLVIEIIRAVQDSTGFWNVSLWHAKPFWWRKWLLRDTVPLWSGLQRSAPVLVPVILAIRFNTESMYLVRECLVCVSD